MKLKEEMREAAAVKMDHGLYGSTAHDIRTGASATLGGEAMAAALSVCDEYEAVEVQAEDGHYLRLPNNPYWDHDKPSFTVYRKKQKPEPTLLEAVEEVGEILGSVLDVERGRTSRASVRLLESAFDSLAEAIAKEKARQ